jgi:membrane protein involved in colicin uptake
MTLMEAEMKELRQANEELSKRRRAKKTRLRQGGSLTLQEAQNLQDQDDIARQIEQESQAGVVGRRGPKRACGAVVSAARPDTMRELVKVV